MNHLLWQGVVAEDGEREGGEENQLSDQQVALIYCLVGRGGGGWGGSLVLVCSFITIICRYLQTWFRIGTDIDRIRI